MPSSDEAFAWLASLADEVAAGTVQVCAGDLRKLAAAAGIYVAEIRVIKANVKDLVQVDSFSGLEAVRALRPNLMGLRGDTPSGGLPLVQLYERRIITMQSVQARFQNAIDNYPGPG